MNVLALWRQTFGLYLTAGIHVVRSLPAAYRHEARELRDLRVFRRIAERDPYEDWRSEDAGVPRGLDHEAGYRSDPMGTHWNRGRR